jgi:predicted RNA-binding Zn-ribbon protein involved in translation (DUF1610 family)
VTDFIIEHQCPQCGAPAQLQESDRIVRCRFCRTNSYLMPTAYFRYCLPHRAPAGVQLIYLPYWRLKGMLFSCLPGQMHHRVVDVSLQALETADLPPSLGLRSQTQKLRFVAPDSQALFLKPQLTAAHIKTTLTEQINTLLPQPILHQAFVGETMSLIYSPFYVGAKVMDGVLNAPVKTARAAVIADLARQPQAAPWPLTFIPTLCPNCGWDLEGRSDAMALNCAHCQSVWYPRQGKLHKITTAHAPGGDDRSLQLPFWRITAEVEGVSLKSYVDLIKLANLPKVPQPGWEDRQFHFWAPAFKIRPQAYITVSTHLTLSQPGDTLAPGPPQGRLQTINLPVSEAAESLKLSLSGFMRPRERMLAKLPALKIKPLSALLVYLPFAEDHHELIHRGLNLAINKAMLGHARNL